MVYSGNLAVNSDDPDESSVVFTLSGSGTVFRENILSLGSVSVAEGGHVRVPISLSNTDQVSGFQFDVALPTGVTFMSDSLFKMTRAYDHNVDAQVNGSVLQILLYSDNNTPLLLEQGPVVEFSLLANAEPNYYPLSLSDIMITDLSGDDVYTAHQDGMLQVGSGTPPPQVADLRLSHQTLDFMPLVV